jgi:diamine N-acetyltransferase
MAITLQPITQATVRQVLRLSVSPAQASYVASNAVSLAQALFHPEAWYRAICLDDAPAGFVMLEDPLLLPEPPAAAELSLWRFMVDQAFQGRGVGRQALELVVAHARHRGAYATLFTSYVPGPHGPEGFYRKFGFRETGRMDGSEVVLALAL